MLILFPKRNGVKIATTIIFEAMLAGAGFHYLLGMLAFARKFGAITEAEEKGILDYIEERG